MELEKLIKEFEEQTNHKVVYITKSGSKLYGTDTPTSDTDYKGIFIPDEKSVLLKTDLTSYSNNTNNSKEKNGAEDIDFTMHSVYSFFDQLQRSETGGVDVLFSMFREDTIVYQEKLFTDLIKKYYPEFMNKNMKSFIGYALGQTKKFGIKGSRYNELDKFVNLIKVMPKNKEARLETLYPNLENIIEASGFKYIKFEMAPGSRGNGVVKDILYLSVLGKKFSGSITVEYFMERIESLYNQFGNRTKTVANTETKTDYKALSHSLRIAQEVKELLETGFITFPLKNADEIRAIKSGNGDVDDILQKIQETLEEVDVLLESTRLPEQSNKELMKEILLGLVKNGVDKKYIQKGN